MMTLDEPLETVGETAFRRIREDIIHGQLQPGFRLAPQRLRERYDVGVGTLREILSRLASEGFVVAEGQRGFEVAPATAAELSELGDLRLLLESHALERSFATGDLEWEARVVAAHHRLASVERALLAGDAKRTPQWVAYDRSFHEALISGCGSRALMTVHATVFDRFLRYHMLAESFRGLPVTEDHAALLELALARDVAGAAEMLARHVQKGIEHVLATGRFDAR
jgi:DNA-binding GntR family transcriptional regulator